MAVNRKDDSKVRVFNVKSTLSETRGDLMKPGMSVLGRVVVDHREDVPLARRDRMRFDGERYWLRAGDVTTEEVEVHPIARNGVYYVLDEEQDAAALQRMGIGGPAEARTEPADDNRGAL